MQVLPSKRPCTPYVHVHPYQREMFTLLQGQLAYRLADQIYTCNVQTCPTPIVVPPLVPHTFWMHDNHEDLILIVRIEPTYADHGLRATSFENIVGVQRDRLMSIWQAFLFVDNIEAFPVFLSLPYMKPFVRLGACIGRLLGYRIEYDEYTTRT